VCISSEIGRDPVMHQLGERGIPSRPYFTPIHLQPFYAQRFGYRRGDFPVTEEAGDTCLALPFSGVMTEDQVDLVCASLRAALAP
jgi:perosamine synthetase